VRQGGGGEEMEAGEVCERKGDLACGVCLCMDQALCFTHCSCK
jgi:hypothetical protein